MSCVPDAGDLLDLARHHVVLPLFASVYYDLEDLPGVISLRFAVEYGDFI